MASELIPNTHWTAAQTRAQFAAIARLRWRITANQFKRKGGAGELVGAILMYLIFSVFALGMMVLAASMSLLAVHSGHLSRLDLVLWGAFAACQFVNIQVGQPGTVFDPTQLIRFPMRSGTYVAIRLFFGLLSPGNILAALLSFAIAIGITIADTSLWLYAFVALVVFAITNAIFSRMVFAWVDRWLSTRRAREVFTACIFVFSLGFQYLNVTFNPAYHHHHHHGAPSMEGIAAAIGYYHRAQPFVGPLPPGLITSALLGAHQGRIGLFFAYTFACLGFAAFFFAIFAWRTSIEFRGENLSDAASAAPANKKRTSARVPVAIPLTHSTDAQPGLPSTVSAVFGKEFLQIRRNTGLLFGLIAPIFFVFLYAGMVASRNNTPWVFPAAMLYTMLGIAPLSYNSFGLEATGVQFYFLAPIRLRDVFLAKNLVNFLLAAIEVAVVLVVVARIAAVPSAATLIATVLWTFATLLLTTTLGNRRSITTPKKIDLGRTVSKQASQMSALIAFGVLLGSAAVGGGFLLLAMYFDKQWILLPIFLVFTGCAFLVYRQGLRSIDAFTLAHRDGLFEELCKK